MQVRFPFLFFVFGTVCDVSCAHALMFIFIFFTTDRLCDWEWAHQLYFLSCACLFVCLRAYERTRLPGRTSSSDGFFGPGGHRYAFNRP